MPFRRVLNAMVLLLGLVTVSCAHSLYLNTSGARPDEVKGTYTLILYGARFSGDIENVAILIKDGTGYVFEVYAPDFEYKVRKSVPAEEALAEAQRFVGFHYAFRRSHLSTILTKDGSAIGYEVRPLYSPLDFGYTDVLDIVYSLHDRKVTARIRLIQELERARLREDRDFPFRMMR